MLPLYDLVTRGSRPQRISSLENLVPEDFVPWGSRPQNRTSKLGSQRSRMDPQRIKYRIPFSLHQAGAPEDLVFRGSRSQRILSLEDVVFKEYRSPEDLAPPGDLVPRKSIHRISPLNDLVPPRGPHPQMISSPEDLVHERMSSLRDLVHQRI